MLGRVDERGFWHLGLHAGQLGAWRSSARFVAMLAGTQGGKTVFGPHWLAREIRRRGPGDYLVVTPTFALLELKALPAFRGVFEDALGLGRYTGAPVRRFRFDPSAVSWFFRDGVGSGVGATQVFFGYAAEPESLESATAKAAWLDEAGQRRFKLGAWEAVQRRLSIAQGRALITTTPYNLGWLKQQFFDRWERGEADYDVVRFESIANPAFPREEFERAKRELPAWKFNLFYRAVWDRPAGLIYDEFDPGRHVVRGELVIPGEWPRYMGVDFGGVNTAAVFGAVDPGTGRLVVYREYLAGGRSAEGHVSEMLAGEVGIPFAVGGSGSEVQWRREFGSAGLAVAAPAVTSVEVGIDRVYAALVRGSLVISERCAGLLEELASYSRELDEYDQPTEAIADKSTFHLADALRYLVSWGVFGPALSSMGEGGFVVDPRETRGW